MSYRTLFYMIYGFGHQIPELGNKRIILYLKGKENILSISSLEHVDISPQLAHLSSQHFLSSQNIIQKTITCNFCIFFPNGGDETNLNKLFSS